jgi:hypothetical protein
LVGLLASNFITNCAAFVIAIDYFEEAKFMEFREAERSID